MRFRPAAIAGLLVAAWLVPSTPAEAAAPGVVTGMADSATLSLPVIVQGRLLDAGGRPLAGTVRLHAWPRWTGTETAAVELPLVAWSEVGQDGVFALRSTPGQAALAGPAGKSRNLVLVAGSGTSRYETHFARRPARTAWLSGADEPAESLDIRFDTASGDIESMAGPGRRPMISACHRRQIEEYPGVETTVGEVNSSEEIEQAFFRYEEREDSHVSVAIEAGGGGWRAGGSHHLDSATSAKGTFNITDGGNYRLTSPFTYVRYMVTCGDNFNDHEEIAAERWEGGGRQIAHNRLGCKDFPEHTRDYPAQYELERNKREAYTWGGAASVAGASFTARTGFSKQATSYWKFDRSKPYHQACGNDGDANNSSRVFIGLETPYPVDDCRPGRPC